MRIIKKVSQVFILLALFAGTSYAANPGIGVADFKNTATGAGWWSAGVGGDLASMVTNELASNKKFKRKFRIVERSKLESIIREQDLAANKRISPGTGAKLGKLIGAKYMILGALSSYEENTGGTLGGISLGNVTLGGNRKSAYLAIDLRVVNTTTGEIAFARTIEGRSKSFGFSIGLVWNGIGGDFAKQKKTPAGKAVRAAVVEIVDYLECAMVVKDSCVAEYDRKEQKRKESLKDKLSLD